MSPGHEALLTMIEFMSDGRGAGAACQELSRRFPERGWDIAALEIKQLAALWVSRAESRAQPRPSTVNWREFKDVHEKAEYYRQLGAESLRTNQELETLCEVTPYKIDPTTSNGETE